GRGAPQARPAHRGGLRRARAARGPRRRIAERLLRRSLSAMLDVEILGLPAGNLAAPELRRLIMAAAQTGGVRDGHVAIEFVDAARIAELNAHHRGKSGPTDVLSFPVDGAAAGMPAGARELGDVVICAEH